MDLGFSVNTGPLSQISLSIASFDTAVHLATGAYGWWKSRSRALSLTEVLASEHGQLSACTTFSPHVHAEARSRGRMRGVAMKDGRLEALDLPNASTAVNGEPGLVCLRALTTGLLCLFDVAACTAILAQVIPTTLVNYDLEDQLLKVEGPLLASLRQYVSSVSVEEDANTLRSDTMRVLQESLQRLNRDDAPPDTAFRQTSITPVEQPLVIGVVQWILTSAHKRVFNNRPCNNYPTRSLTAWSVALILSHLGFEISASYRTISTPELYARYVSPSNTSGVFLVTCNHGETDPLETVMMHGHIDGGLKPRILPIKAIPWVVFRHLERGDTRSTVGNLSDLWDVSFTRAMSAFGTPTVTPNATVQLPVLRPDELIHSHHKSLLGLWNHQLSRVLASSMQQFVPATAEILQEVDRFSQAIFSERRDDAVMDGGSGADNWYCMSAIILATIYAAVCKSLHTQATPDQRVEVALPADLLFSRKPYQWAVLIGGAMDGVTTCSEWAKMMLEICTAIEPPRTAFDGNTYHQTGTYPARSPPFLTEIFGAQANGVFVVSDFLLNPSLNPGSLATYHIAYGQSLHFPHDSDGLVKASTVRGQEHMIGLNPEPEYTVLQSGKSELHVRIDVAPDWDRDPRRVSFHARVGGMHHYTFSPLTVSQRLATAVVGCKCSEHKSSLDVPRHERWQPVSMSQLFQPTIPTSSPNSRLGVEAGNYVCVRAGGDVASQLLCLGVVEGQSVVLATECLGCAYSRLFETRFSHSVKSHEAILIDGLM